jgi:hypothetical protein
MKGGSPAFHPCILESILLFPPNPNHTSSKSTPRFRAERRSTTSRILFISEGLRIFSTGSKKPPIEFKEDRSGITLFFSYPKSETLQHLDGEWPFPTDSRKGFSKTQSFNQKSWEATIWFGEMTPPYLRHNLYKETVVQTSLLLLKFLLETIKDFSVKIKRFYERLDLSILPPALL